MATTETTFLQSRTTTEQLIPPLHNGDRLTGPEFERRYMAMPGVKKAELIEGVVYMPSPVSRDHGLPHLRLSTWVGVYVAHTPGVEGVNEVTTRLDLDNRPQPDVALRICPEHGGQSSTEDRYFLGAPELLVEVSASTVSHDLHDKLTAYHRNGVREYVVCRVEDGELDYFILRDKKFQKLQPAADGIYKSEVFPGLWLDAAALLRGELIRVLDIVKLGMQTPEHAAFVEHLSKAKASR